MATKIYKRLALWVLPKHLIKINKKAKKTGISVSKFMRKMIDEIK